MATKAQQAAQREAIEELREIFPKGSTVGVIIRHVSRSGMQRTISVVTVKGEIRNVSSLAARALGWPMKYGAHDGVKVNGAGMDMGFHLVYSLSTALYGYENGGGYALNHRQI